MMTWRKVTKRIIHIIVPAFAGDIDGVHAPSPCSRHDTNHTHASPNSVTLHLYQYSHWIPSPRFAPIVASVPVYLLT